MLFQLHADQKEMLKPSGCACYTHLNVVILSIKILFAYSFEEEGQLMIMCQKTTPWSGIPINKNIIVYLCFVFRGWHIYIKKFLNKSDPYTSLLRVGKPLLNMWRGYNGCGKNGIIGLCMLFDLCNYCFLFFMSLHACICTHF